MANMSYCRFQNTLSDLRDCYDHMADFDEGRLSPDEHKAACRLMDLCEKIAKQARGEE